MKNFLPLVYKVLGSRIARNFYFWFIYQWAAFAYLHIDMHYPMRVYITFRVINLCIMLALVYCNNLILIPRLLVRGKVFLYFTIAFILTLATSVLYNIDLKIIQQHFPDIKVFEISSIEGCVTQDWTLKGVLVASYPFFTVLALLVFCFSMAWYMNDYTAQRRIAIQAQKKQAEAELNFLKSQINPHFLFNTMNNLYSMTVNTPGPASETILKLSSILRYMLYETDAEKVSFSREKEIMEAYIELELIRLKNINNLQLTIHADRDYDIPPLLWAPVLENAFKYGTDYIADQFEIKFRFTIINNELSIYSDNKFKTQAMDTGSENSGSKGIGLENLKKRLALIYPGKHLVQTRKDKNHFFIDIRIDLS
jgi:two-component system, LytTR family, sensor kinase